MTLRATARLLSLLRVRSATLPDVPPSEHDWYANLLWINRRKCPLLVHAETLFPIFVADARKAALTPIGPWLTAAIEDHLRSERIPIDALGTLDPNDVLLAKTMSRSVLGVMNEIAHDIRYQVAAMGGFEPAETVGDRIAGEDRGAASAHALGSISSVSEITSSRSSGGTGSVRFVPIRSARSTPVSARTGSLLGRSAGLTLSSRR